MKCIVWDLDCTLWEGVLLEGGARTLRPGIRAVLETLDARGILHSIASRNEEGPALARLAELGVAEYFLVPEIGWGSKSAALARVATALNIGVDALAFVDDDPSERAAVELAEPAVLSVDAAEAAALAERPECIPDVITADARERRLLYRGDLARRRAEEEFDGHPQEFLATLGMHLVIRHDVGDADIERAHELTVRTHQLNSTGYTYSREELVALRDARDHHLVVAGLDDRFGSYGTIGLALIALAPQRWTLKLLLTSCRVMARGVGALLLNNLMREARWHGVRLRAEFIPNGRNRVMYLAFRFAGFREIARRADLTILEHDLGRIDPWPAHVRLEVEGAAPGVAGEEVA